MQIFFKRIKLNLQLYSQLENGIKSIQRKKKICTQMQLGKNIPEKNYIHFASFCTHPFNKQPMKFTITKIHVCNNTPHLWMLIANLSLPSVQFNQKWASALCRTSLISNLYTVCKIILITVKHHCFLKFGSSGEKCINMILTESKSTVYTTRKYFPTTHTNSSTFKSKFKTSDEIWAFANHFQVESRTDRGFHSLHQGANKSLMCVQKRFPSDCH